jgi:hypothetical protein
MNLDRFLLSAFVLPSVHCANTVYTEPPLLSTDLGRVETAVLEQRREADGDIQKLFQFTGMFVDR